MDVPKLLERINDFQQNTTDLHEIQNFADNIQALIKESTTGVKSVTCDNAMVNRINNLLPKSTHKQEVKLFNLLAKYANLTKIYIKIPTTLIRLENTLYLIQNKNDDNSVISKQCTETEFFNLPNAANEKGSPVFVYKSPAKGVVALFSYENASRIWNTLEVRAMMQQFIQSKSDPATITRILWRSGMKNKYFIITNKKNAARRLSKCSSQGSNLTFTYKRAKSTVSDAKIGPSDFRYSQLMLTTSQSINNPYKVGTKTPFPHKVSTEDDIPEVRKEEEKIYLRKSSTILFKGYDLDPKSPKGNKDISSNSEGQKEYLVLTKDIDSCYASEGGSKIPELESMVEQIVDFLNVHVFKKHGLKGVVLDFVKDKNNAWYLLECKEFNVDFMIPIEIERTRKSKTRIEDNPFNRRNLNRAETLIDNIDQRLPEINTNQDFIDENEEELLALACPFKIRSKPKKSEHGPVSEEDFLERLNKVSEKIDKISCTHAPPAKLVSLDKDELVQEYLNSHNHFSSQIGGTRSPAHSYTLPGCCSFNEDAQEDKDYTKRIVTEVASNLDDMKLKINIAKLRKVNILAKYGGEPFWGKFIFSLYNKILANEMLNKYFKNSKLQSFSYIVTGYFKLFNGNLNMELKKRIKAAHYFRGINEREFDCYVDLFNHTLIEFSIDEEDRVGVVSELRSMKNIICRELMI